MDMAKKLMLGNEAIARGAYEAGVTVVSSYPGTPSTEITEYIVKYDEIYAEWAPNEKVAAEVAVGASAGGARSMTCMKHVGLNVAADPVFTASYTGVTGGMVICVADDPGMHSSQNEQDSRHYARASKMPMLEPATSDECIRYVKLAYELSEQYDTPVYVRLTTRVAHSQSLVITGEREEAAIPAYKKDVAKRVMMPAMAVKRHVVVEERTSVLLKFAEESEINAVEINDSKIGVIASGIGYLYAKEALGDQVSYLKLGMVYPLPTKLIQDFARKVKKLYIIEELDPVFEAHCKSIGVPCFGKEIFSMLGEYNSLDIREKILGVKPPEFVKIEEEIPVRPPVLCPGCPHRGIFYILKKLKLIVFGDIGCYTLGALKPLESIDYCLCMGGSISGALGAEKASKETFAGKSVAVIGDSTFIHSGITSLIDVVYNKGVTKVLILDNSITGMTGHQNNPLNGRTIKDEPTVSIDLIKLCESIGVKNVVVTDPFDLVNTEKVIREELIKDEPSVIIVQRPCALLKNVKFDGPYEISEACKSCKMCMRLGCPAITIKENGKAAIDASLCVGCGLCSSVCKFGAIKGGAKG